MVCELISVGTEILMGSIVNTNAAYLAKECALLGINMYTQTVIGDNDARLSQVFREAFNRADVVILTGGLGPTEDDLTKETVAKVLDVPLVEDIKAKEMLMEYFARKQYKLTENNYKQVQVPQGCQVLYNKNGTAPGIIVEKYGHAAILLPGPPSEMIPMFEEYVHPFLEKKSDGVFYQAVIKECGVGESILETQLLDLIDAQTNPTIATYASTATSEVRITAKAQTYESARNLAKPIVKEIRKRLGDHVYSTVSEENMEHALYHQLKKHDLKITFAESCTGGLAAAKMINVPDISDYFSQSFIAYTNKAKRKLLGVNKDTLKKYSAVSEEVAKEMAKGALMVTDSDLAVAITGYAGPQDSKETPKGLVYLAVAIHDHVFVKDFHFSGNRAKIRESAAIYALNLARMAIMKEYD